MVFNDFFFLYIDCKKPRQGIQLLDESNQDMTGYQATWMQELPQLLLQLGVQHPSTSRVCNLYQAIIWLIENIFKHHLEPFENDIKLFLLQLWCSFLNMD